ncbi:MULTISPECIES: hypothetical protein [Acetobacter]|uniref:hypothetical protein n=1 Tax=Acetobacter TaxID=434 RepID=UPI000B06211D|nr:MULTISPECIES: hypothetical protein [Acetobacter]KAA8421815.1 hypothetical protein FKW54_12700 [Acetobacter pomorum]KAA8435253.1 hypothetical protein FKW50_07820 [Acetobacter pomorum]KAA8448266.1 hypothetical protein FKW52_13805 [Acetobacter pomorum]
MAANKSIRVVCPPSVHEAVDAMAEATGASRSSVISQLLEGISPKMLELASAIKAANDAPSRLVDAVSSGLSDAAQVFRSQNRTPTH